MRVDLAFKILFGIVVACGAVGSSFADPFVPIRAKARVFFMNPFLPKDYFKGHDVIADWAWWRADGKGEVDLKVPPETGRGAIAPVQYRDHRSVLLKGTGMNPEHVGINNKIRYNVNANEPAVFFDGMFRLRQGMFDIMNSELLNSIGVSTAKPLGLIGIGKDPNTGHEIGIYAREFLVQTRLSNLQALPLKEARKELDAAIENLFSLKITEKRLDYVEYFFWLTETLARQTARMQASGFEHGVLHSQQFTLAGEITDLATGRWIDGLGARAWGVEPKQFYFRFERQPLLTLNMLMRTHAVTAEIPVRLEETSITRRSHSKSLLGLIREVNPDAYEKILARDPEKRYWETFDRYFQAFDLEFFRKRFKPRRYFVKSVADFLSTVEAPRRAQVEATAQWAYESLAGDLKVRIIPRQLVFQKMKERLGPELLAHVEASPETFGDAPATIAYAERVKTARGGFREPNYFIDPFTYEKYLGSRLRVENCRGLFLPEAK